MDPSQTPPPTSIDWGHASYLLIVCCLGGLSAVAKVLGSSEPLSWRVLLSYGIAGGMAAVAVVLLLVETYGFSYFLCGAGILAGYKAFDILALLGTAISRFAANFLKKGPK